MATSAPAFQYAELCWEGLSHQLLWSIQIVLSELQTGCGRGRRTINCQGQQQTHGSLAKAQYYNELTHYSTWLCSALCTIVVQYDTFWGHVQGNPVILNKKIGEVGILIYPLCSVWAMFSKWWPAGQIWPGQGKHFACHEVGRNENIYVCVLSVAIQSGHSLTLGLIFAT